VQTTHKIEASSATSYAEYLTSTTNRAEYYTSDGKIDPSLVVPSKWHGSERVLKELGLTSHEIVTTRDLVITMNGFNPVTKEPLRPAGSNGERVAGIELQMAPPKTVSAVWATASPYRREQIEAAHHAAVASALKRTEREVALVRRKTGRVTRFEKAKSLFAAELVHTSSRLAKDQDRGGIPDPQLHSHVIVMAAERQDGKLAAIESKRLYRTARENGAWYRAELANNLKNLGLRLDRRTGNGERYFEVHGVSEDLAQRWSKRAEDVHRAARIFRQRYGREPRGGELSSLTTRTRGPKSTASPIDINAAWKAQGEEYGLTKDYVESLFNDRNIEQHANVDLRQQILDAVTSERSMITSSELKAKAYEMSAGVGRPEDGDRVIEELTRSGEILELEDHTWTTRHLRELEQATVDIAERRAKEIVAPVSEASLKQARREIGWELKGSLNQEQREALDTITGPGGMALLVGRAGTGKGVTISAAARAWKLEGCEVIGTSIAGSTAELLKDTTKLDKAYNSNELINGIENGSIKIGPKTVVIFDEAAMADTERHERLAQLTDQAHSKFFGAGDPAQLSAIGAGGIYKELLDRAPTAELKKVIRANHAWERTAWEQVRNGEPGPALAAYQANDRMNIHDTRVEATVAMVDHWDQVRKTLPGNEAVMITDATNLERDQVNAMAQERRIQAGELGAHQVELPGKPYGLRAGDEVIFTAQFRGPGQPLVKNGISATVIDTSRGDEDNRVTLKTKQLEPREVHVDTSEFSDLSLRYAVHIVKAQGITAERSGIMTGGWQTDREHIYTELTRAREETQIYVSREDLGEQGFDIGAMERLAERMQRSRAQEASITKRLADRTTSITKRLADRTTERHRTAQPHPTPERDPELERTNDRVIDTPQQIEDIERQALLMRDQGVDEATIVKEIAQEHSNPDATGTRTTQDKRRYEREIADVVEKQQQRRLDEELHSHQALDRDGEPHRDVDRPRDADRDDQQGSHQASGRGEEPDIELREVDLRDLFQPQRDRLRDWEGSIDQDHQVNQADKADHHDRDIDQPQGGDRHNDPSTDRDPYIEQAIQEERDRQQAWDQGIDPDRDPYIEQAIQEERDRQQAWDQGIDPDRDNDRDMGFEID
jgi:conjugative relaxase-like TrwC/TraI family protein